jgi:MoaA/NifB/PqqE/SkfB family radical SAM enzyme
LEPKNVTLALEVVAACSLRCRGCWVAKAQPEMWTTEPRDVMPEPIFLSALAFGKTLGISRLSLLEGEPTMHHDFPALVRRAKLEGYDVGVTTNGVCSAARLEALLASPIQAITFSVDGSSATTHDRLRPSPANRSTFTTTIESIQRAIQFRPHFSYTVLVNHTIFPENINEVDDIVRLSVDLGIDQIRLHYPVPNDLVDSRSGPPSTPGA